MCLFCRGEKAKKTDFGYRFQSIVERAYAPLRQHAPLLGRAFRVRGFSEGTPSRPRAQIRRSPLDRAALRAFPPEIAHARVLNSHVEALGPRREGRTTRTRADTGIHRASPPGLSFVSRVQGMRGTRRARVARFDARGAHARAFPSPIPHRARITISARDHLRVRFAGGGEEARGRGRPSVPETARRVRRACSRADAFASVPERAPAGESAHTARCPRRISRGKQTPTR